MIGLSVDLVGLGALRCARGAFAQKLLRGLFTGCRLGIPGPVAVFPAESAGHAVFILTEMETRELHVGVKIGTRIHQLVIGSGELEIVRFGDVGRDILTLANKRTGALAAGIDVVLPGVVLAVAHLDRRNQVELRMPAQRGIALAALISGIDVVARRGERGAVFVELPAHEAESA